RIGREGYDLGPVTARRDFVRIVGDAGIAHEPDLTGALDVCGAAAVHRRPAVGFESVADDRALDVTVSLPTGAKHGVDVLFWHGRAAPDVVGDVGHCQVTVAADRLPPPKAATRNVVAGPPFGVEVREALAEIVRVKQKRQTDLADVRGAFDRRRLGLGPRESRQ